MSTYYYVTRNPGPFTKESRRVITEEKWLAAVALDPELSIEEPDPSPGLPKNAVWAVWHSYPGGYPAWFSLIDGDIEVKGIDEALFGKLKQFASALDARIFCETGEEFT